MDGKDILGDLDLEILTDITEIDGSTDEKPLYKPCYAAGWSDDLSAGIWGSTMSPWFDTVGEVYDWAVENREWLYEQFDIADEG